MSLVERYSSAAALTLLRTRKLLGAFSSPHARRAIRLGVAPTIEHRHLKWIGARHVIDVGANRGQFSLVARSIFPECSIEAFEPIPACAAVFRKLNLGEVQELALSDGAEDHVQSFNLSKSNDSSSLMPIGGKQIDFFPGTEHDSTIRVRTSTLDRALRIKLQRPSLLKLDVQGSELSVLRGAIETLDQLDYIYAELSLVELYEGQPLASEIVGWLDSHGYNLVSIHALKTVRQSQLQFDGLFAKRL